MGIKFKSIIIISIIFLSALIAGLNFGFVSTNPENISLSPSEARSDHRSNGDFNWSQIEVLSEPVIGQDFNTRVSNWSAVAVEGNKIYVVWEDGNNTSGSDTDWDIFYRYFDGSSWSKTQVISEPVPGQDISIGESLYPAIAVENSNIYVVWRDSNNTNGAGPWDWDIFYRCNLTSSGWEKIQVISEPVEGSNFNIGGSMHPDIEVILGKSHIIWEDQDTSNITSWDFDIFYRNIKDPSPLFLNQPNVSPTFGNTSTNFNLQTN